MTAKERATALEQSEVETKKQEDDDLPMVSVLTSMTGDDLSGRTVAEVGPYPAPQGEPRSLLPWSGEASGRTAADDSIGSSRGVGGMGPSDAGGVAERLPTNKMARRVAERLLLLLLLSSLHLRMSPHHCDLGK